MEAGLTEVGDHIVPFLNKLEGVIEARRASSTEKSYTKSLLDAGAEKIGAKLLEEAGELRDAIAGESDDRVSSEAADLLFHTLVGLRSRDLSWRSVIEVLSRRFGTGGHEEKASRKLDEDDQRV
jgi:phosphoribosyl-ATP pyrophosphohydrolase/phosphoribosyl-AMP cyclohydrolase